MQHGGNAGEAGMNFLFQSLYQPGMSPFAVQGLMQGGPFASTRSVFGPGSALKGWYRGSLDGTQNIDRIRAQVGRMGLDPQAAAASMASVFGLSMGQANSLLTLNGKPLEDAKAAIRAKEQDAQKDPYQSIIDAVNDVNKSLTDAGLPLLSAINPIREGVASLVEHFVGGGKVGEQRQNGFSYMRATAGHGLLGGLYGGLANAGQRFVAQQRMNVADYGAASLAAKWDRELGLPVGAIELQMDRESAHFAKHPISKAGAMGWGQFMPGTLASLRSGFRDKFGHDPDVWNHTDSVNLTGLYMQQLMKRYGGDYNKALAAYNAGPGTLDKALSGRGGLRKETTDYVAALGIPIPPEDRSPASTAAPTVHKVEVSGSATITDAQGRSRGTVILRQQGQPQASGTG